MTIRKWYEIGCDICGCGEQFCVDSQSDANKQAKEHGWIIINKQYICDKYCLNEFELEKTRNRGCKQ